MYNALISGLEDYTTDERGDVGSWVRIASIQGLTSVSLTLLTLAKSDVTYTEYIPVNLYQKAIGGILKQGVERLDNVRQQAGQSVVRLLSCPVHSNAWKFHGEELFKGLLLSDAAEDGASISHGWQDSSWIFPKAMQFLEVPEYRPAVLAGLLMSVGSKTESTQRHVRTSLVTYAKKLPVDDVGGGGIYNLQALIGDLVAEAKSNLALNGKVVPVLQALNVLLEADALERLCDSEDGIKSLQVVLSIVSRGVSKLKSIHRIQECMRTLVNLLAIPPISNSCVPRLVEFLTHQYPTIRAETARYLYLFLQTRDIGKDTEEVEEVLLETAWFSCQSDVQEKALTVVDRLGKARDD